MHRPEKVCDGSRRFARIRISTHLGLFYLIMPGFIASLGGVYVLWVFRILPILSTELSTTDVEVVTSVLCCMAFHCNSVDWMR
jgi:hypothetical protein